MDELLSRGVSEIINKDHLAKRLEKGDKLRVKFGIDPTAPDIHLGHTVPLRKLRQFQDAGHIAVLIIGDFTAMIGDPSGRDKTRPALTVAEVKEHAKAYEQQAFKILDQSKTEVRWQSEWFQKFALNKVIELASKVSTWHLLSHETFATRKQKNQSLMHHETLYPLLQGYDSVAVKADVEIGAVEQKFNLLAGRIVQQAYNHAPQDVIITPYLLGTDGKQKMSKSFGNTINLNDRPEQMFGKVMSIPDSLILPYFELLTDLKPEAFEKVKQELKQHPRHAKSRLAFLIVQSLYDDPTAESAQAAFDAVFRDKSVPQKVEEIVIDPSIDTLIDILITAKLAVSRTAATTLIRQGGVKVDGVKIGDPNQKIKIKDTLIQVGKRRFARLVRG